jgi:SOS-response transcriptional repressor LexA
MAQRTNKAIVRRIERRLAELGKSARGASMEAVNSSDLIRNWQRQPEVMPGIDSIEALAPVLDTSPCWLAFGIETEATSEHHHRMRILGEVAAGLWLDVDSADEQVRQEPAPFVFDPHFPEEAQYALRVRGTSINRVARHGELLQCLDLGITGIVTREEDLVIVERRRAQGSQKEVTAKRWRQKGSTVQLMPDSDDPRWTEPISLRSGRKIDDEVVQVIALVVAVYRPLRAP